MEDDRMEEPKQHPCPEFVEWMDSVKNGLSLKSDIELSKVLGVARMLVCRWREGSDIPSGEKLCVIADKLSIDVRKLLRMVGWLKK